MNETKWCCTDKHCIQAYNQHFIVTRWFDIGPAKRVLECVKAFADESWEYLRHVLYKRRKKLLNSRTETDEEARLIHEPAIDQNNVLTNAY